MGSGAIYAVIVALWAMVLVPMWLRRHDQVNESRSIDRFRSAMRSLSHRREDTVESREVLMPTRRREIDVTVTGPSVRPQGRSAARAGARQRSSARYRPTASAAGRAATRRRRSLAVLVGLLLVVGLASLLGALPAWSLAVPALLLVAFVVVARRQVTAAEARRHRAARRSARRHDDDEVPEQSVRPGGRAVEDSPAPAGAVDVVSATDGTWMPVDAPLPTYVTAPRASRIPRVIDLTTPGTWTGAAMVEEARRARSTTIDGASFADMYVDDDIAVDASLHAPVSAEFFDQMIDDDEQAPPLRRAVNE